MAHARRLLGIVPTVGLAAVAAVSSGCVELISYAPQLLQMGVETAQGMENVDVKAAVAPGATAEDLAKIKRVSVVIGTRDKSSSSQVRFGGGDLEHVMGDNIALELLNLGFQVVERASLDRVLNELSVQLTDIADPATAAKVGKVLGAQAVVIGNVVTTQSTRVGGGFMGIGTQVNTAQNVSDATLRVVGVEQADVLLIVTLSYKHGQKPTEASKIMAAALAQRLKDPKGQKTSAETK